MLELTALYCNNTPYFDDIEKLYNQHKKMLYDFKDCADFVSYYHGHFWICTEQDKFLGCIWLDKWQENSVYLGGFSIRKNYKTFDAVKMLINVIFADYNVNKIYVLVDKNDRCSKLYLQKNNFKYAEKEKEDYLYFTERS
jgi:hypothetical protein